MLITWQQALDYLYQRANWEAVPAGPQTAFKLGRIQAVLADLGQPHRAWPAVHVAGTNGKGTTCCFVASALRESGRRVGLYTSPHLHTVRERIQVDGVPISEAAVLAWLNARRTVLERHEGLTTFEALTALAFDFFAARAVDVAVVEVGLGGRLDTTNVVSPAVSVFTPIDLDHTGVLGPSLELIAADKAGIMRPGVPVVSARQHPVVAEVLTAAANEVGAPMTRTGREVTWHRRADRNARQTVTVSVAGRSGAASYEAEIQLLGDHQAENAATAVAALHVLRDLGWAMAPEAVSAGLAAARWPARYEHLGRRPTVVVDAAHNPSGARALAAAVDRYDPGRRWLVLGLSGDKDVAGILDALLPGVYTVIATQADHPRAMSPERVADLVAARSVAVRVARSPAQALAHALSMAEPKDVIVAGGSIFLAADVREAWAARGRMPMPPRDPPTSIRPTVA